MKTHTPNEAVRRAVDRLNGAKEAAALLGVTPQAVYFWLNGERQFPAELAPKVERATGGAVRCEELRPDVEWKVLREAA